MAKEFTHCVFVGRFQPFHNAHLEVVRHALSIAERVVIVIGSCRAAANIKNPFSYEQRCDMIRLCFEWEDLWRIDFVPVRDYFYSESTWVAEVQQKVNAVTDGSRSVAITGSFKDASSYYISMFPQWIFSPAPTTTPLNATDVRRALFAGPRLEGWQDKVVSGPAWKALVPTGVADWINGQFVESEKYFELCDEFKFTEDYRTSWGAAPYAPTFVTVDSVVVQSGHVLVVERKDSPGKGLMALPGGFVRPDEALERAALRELWEETGLELAGQPDGVHVFDHPGRSLRGRTITHAFFHDLGGGQLHPVEGSDDAARAFWLPLMDVNAREDEFFEDHAHMINYFVTRR